MELKNTILMAAFGLVMSALAAQADHAQAILKRSILIVIALATLAISVKAEGVPEQLAELQTQITALKATVVALQAQLVTVSNNPHWGWVRS